MALGRPKNVKIDSIRKRWDGTVKPLRRMAWQTPALIVTPSSWSEVLTGEPLPIVQQAALDIAALFDYVCYLENVARDAADGARMYAEVVQLVGHYNDDCHC